MEYPFKDLLPLDEVLEREGYYKDWTHIDAKTFHQISELAKFIREKGHGADTREAMAQALERVYHDAAKSGNANMEVSIARGGFDTLGERLNETTEQLEQTVKKGQVSINDININLGKITPNMVSDELLAQIAGDAAVNAVPPNRGVTKEKIAVKAVGQAEIDGGSVSSSKTNFINATNIKTKNLFDDTKITVDFVTSAESGQTVFLPGYSESEFMDFTPNIKYKTSHEVTVLIFDQSKKLLSNITFDDTAILSVSSNATLMKLRIKNEFINRFMFSKAQDFPLSYTPKYKQELEKYIKIHPEQINNITGTSDTARMHNIKFSPDAVDSIAKVGTTRNLFDKNTVTLNYFTNDLGVAVYNDEYVESDYIKVTKFIAYLQSFPGVISAYDGSKNFLYSQHFDKAVSFTSDTYSESYIKIRVKKSQIETFMFAKRSEFPSEYEDSALYDLGDNFTLTSAGYENITKPIKLTLNDFSGYNQPYHPSVIYIPSGFGGGHYWLVQSPVPLGSIERRDRWEVPVVYKSGDGYNFEAVANPLDDLTPAQIVDGSFMSDPHILYREDLNRLEVWYRLTYSDGLTEIFRKTTTDGVNWTERVSVLPPKPSTDQTLMRSQSVLWDNNLKIYKAWYTNNYGMWYRTSADGVTWNTQTFIKTDYNLVSNGKDHWHIDVNYYDDAYHLLVYSMSTNQLIYYKGASPSDFKYQRIVLETSDGFKYYKDNLYRSVSLKDASGNVRIYATGEDHTANKTCVFMVTAKDWSSFQTTKKIKSTRVTMSDGKTLEEYLELQGLGLI